jgi:23S rRNA pseudouridine1911/1915/1917 synthase
MSEPDELLWEDEVEEELPAPPGAGRVVELQVQHKTTGLRLDQYVVLSFPDYSRSVVQKAIEAGKITVNGAPAKASYRVRLHDQVQVVVPAPTHPLPVPEDIPLDILYEDGHLALVNKPYAMVVHPAKGHWSGTLVNALAFHFGHQLSNLNGDYRPGIVHRLDRDTSGVILIAKEEKAHAALSMQFETRTVFKEYLAITQGVLDRDSDYIEKRIGHHPHDRIKMMATDDEARGKEACTYYEVIERFRGYTLVRCQPRTGRTHQIRVHLGAVGCPVAADKLYSGRDALRLSDLAPAIAPEADEVLLPRQALHALRLRLIHPVTGEVIAVEAPLPPEFEKTLAALRRHRPWR